MNSTNFLQSTPLRRRAVRAMLRFDLFGGGDRWVTNDRFIIRFGPRPLSIPIFHVFLRLHHLLFRTVSTAEEKKVSFPHFPPPFVQPLHRTSSLPMFSRNITIGISMFQLVSTIPKWCTQQPLFFCPMVWMANLYVSWSDPQVADHLTDESAHGLSEENLEVRNKQSLAMFQTLGGYIKIHQSFNDLNQIFGGENFLRIQT